MNNVPTTAPTLSERLFGMLGKTFHCGAILLFALLPFHAFLVTWLQFGLHVPGPLSAWKELLILAMLGLSGVAFLLQPQRPVFDKLDAAIAIFFVIGVGSAILQYVGLGNESYIRIFYGFKYDFLMLAVFLLFRHSPLVRSSLVEKASTIVLIMGTIIAGFALLQATVLPRDFLALFGYTRAFGTWDPSGPLATYQALSADHPFIVRAMGTFAGPNQFAMYCLILVGHFGARFISSRSGSERGNLVERWAVGGGLLTVLGIVLSFSRSAILGLVVATISSPLILFSGMTQWIRKRKASLSIIAIIGGIGILSTFYLLPSTFLSSVFVREGSTQGHWSRSLEGIRGTFEKPLLGHGIGEAGPASTRSDPTGQGWIPENWYLQISLQYGLIGLAAWLTILFLMAKKLYDLTKLPTTDYRLPTALLFSFLAISVACLFLHAWEDSAVAITWWGLAGLALKKPQSAVPI